MKKQELCKQNLTQDQKQPSVVILQWVVFYNVFILCLLPRIVRSSDQGVLVHEFSITDIFNNINHLAEQLY